MQTVRKVFQDIAPKVNLAANPPVENFSPIKVKQYLTENYLKFCVLVVDVETVKDAYGNLTQRTVEYEELLKTAANAVGKIGFHSQNERKYSVFSRYEPGGEAVC